MLKLPDFIVLVYCLVDDLLPVVTAGRKLRTRGFMPKLRDSEAIAMVVIGEFLGICDDEQIWEYFDRHWRSWFPALGSRANFARQAANLWRVTQLMHDVLARALVAPSDDIFVCDGVPIPVCKFGRKATAKLFRGQAAVSYCAAKKEFYYGFKGHLLTTADGLVLRMALTPANMDEREAVWDLVDKVRGWLLGDKGYLSAFFRDELRSAGVDLQTPLRSNMPDSRSHQYVRDLCRTRRIIETVIGQFTERMRLGRTRARDLWHFTARVARKMLAHTLALFLNRKFGREPLDFDGLLAAA